MCIRGGDRTAHRHVSYLRNWRPEAGGPATSIVSTTCAPRPKSRPDPTFSRPRVSSSDSSEGGWSGKARRGIRGCGRQRRRGGPDQTRRTVPKAMQEIHLNSSREGPRSKTDTEDFNIQKTRVKKRPLPGTGEEKTGLGSEGSCPFPLRKKVTTKGRKKRQKQQEGGGSSEGPLQKQREISMSWMGSKRLQIF